MGRKGFLLVLTEPPPPLEEEFNAWYDTEHIPERLAIPGFESALRFVCLDGFPRYLAMYDLASIDVLDSAAYRRVAGDNFSPWTKRVTSRMSIYRSVGDQVYPGTLVTRRTARVKLLRFSGLKSHNEAEVIAGMRTAFEGKSAAEQVRVLAYRRGDLMDFLGFVGYGGSIDHHFDLAPFGEAGGALDMVNTYALY